MNKINLIIYKSILGTLALETVENENTTDDMKSKDWYQRLYRVCKKFKQAKKEYVTPAQSKEIKAKINTILIDLRDKYFYVKEYDGWEVNNYSLVCEILAYLVNEKDLIEFKNMLMSLDYEKNQVMCETTEKYKELQSKIYRFISDMIDTIGE